MGGSSRHFAKAFIIVSGLVVLWLCINTLLVSPLGGIIISSGVFIFWLKLIQLIGWVWGGSHGVSFQEFKDGLAQEGIEVATPDLSEGSGLSRPREIQGLDPNHPEETGLRINTHRRERSSEDRDFADWLRTRYL